MGEGEEGGGKYKLKNKKKLVFFFKVMHRRNEKARQVGKVKFDMREIKREMKKEVAEGNGGEEKGKRERKKRIN